MPSLHSDQCLLSFIPILIMIRSFRSVPIPEFVLDQCPISFLSLISCPWSLPHFPDHWSITFSMTLCSSRCTIVTMKTGARSWMDTNTGPTTRERTISTARCRGDTMPRTMMRKWFFWKNSNFNRNPRTQAHFYRNRKKIWRKIFWFFSILSDEGEGSMFYSILSILDFLLNMIFGAFTDFVLNLFGQNFNQKVIKNRKIKGLEPILKWKAMVWKSSPLLRNQTWQIRPHDITGLEIKHP